MQAKAKCDMLASPALLTPGCVILQAGTTLPISIDSMDFLGSWVLKLGQPDARFCDSCRQQ